MPRPLASYDAEIAACESAVTNLTQAYAINARSVTKAAIESTRARLDLLYRQRDAVAGVGGVLVRGQVSGLGSRV